MLQTFIVSIKTPQGCCPVSTSNIMDHKMNEYNVATYQQHEHSSPAGPTASSSSPGLFIFFFVAEGRKYSVLDNEERMQVFHFVANFYVV